MHDLFFAIANALFSGNGYRRPRPCESFNSYTIVTDNIMLAKWLNLANII